MSARWFQVAYVGLDDAPGVGQADVSLSAKQLQAFFQVGLSVAVDLLKKDQINKQVSQ